MKSFLKGIIVGIGKIIPGVSGAMLAIVVGIYDEGIYHINNFKNHKKESIKYLLPIGLGIIISIITFSKIIEYTLNKYYLITMLFFVGLIIGGIPSIYKKAKKKDYLLIIMSFIIFFIISIFNIDNTYIIKNKLIDFLMLFLSGFTDGLGTVVPGISGTALLMILGTYNIIISSLSNITNFSNIIFNLKVLLPFIFGLFIGIILLLKLVSIMFKKYQEKMYSFILGLLMSSVVLLLVKAFKYKIGIGTLCIGIIFLILGIIISNILEKK